MTVLFLIGAAFLGVAVALLLRAIAAPRLRVAAQVQQLEGYGFEQAKPVAEADDRPRGARLAERVGTYAASRVPALKPPARRELMAAGIYGVTPETFHGYRVLAGFGLPVLVLMLSLAGGSSSAVVFLLAIAMGAMAWQLPIAVIRTRGQRRLDRVDRDLPEFVDTMAATIETGLSFASSLQLVVKNFEGPLGAELRLTLQEQNMGLSVDAALTNLVERCDTASVRSLAKAVVHADSLGVSVAAMLRNISVDVRQRRRGQARERAQKAPVKMLFPLVFLIFPAMLLVVLYPTLHALLQVLGG